MGLGFYGKEFTILINKKGLPRRTAGAGRERLKRRSYFSVPLNRI